MSLSGRKILSWVFKFCLIAIFLTLSAPWQSSGEETKIIKIFQAGSLSIPLHQAAEVFEKNHPGVKIIMEASGSVMAVRKITDLGKKADIIAVADHNLIKKMLFPKYTGEYYIFASNEVGITYTRNSLFSDQINEKNWFQILNNKKVKWGFSNPSIDPCGYRTLMVLKLADYYYKKPIFEDLILKNLNIKDNNRIIQIPSQIKKKKKNIFIRPKSVELLGLLEAGAIDYAFEYRSVALQHNLKFLPLPAELNLSSMKLKKQYSRVKIALPGNRIIIGAPVLYGIAVLKNAPEKKAAEEFLKFFLGRDGMKIIKDSYQNPEFPPVKVRNNEK